jgi:hypothetical protein
VHSVLEAVCQWLVKYRGVILILVIFLVISSGGFIQAAESITAARTAAQTQCRFWRDLGDAPLPDKPSPPSKLGVKLVYDSRVAFTGLSCPGNLVPDPSLYRWVHYYRLQP